MKRLLAAILPWRVQTWMAERQWEAKIRKEARPYKDPDFITRTGETSGERSYWHSRGELSPGEHELARLIRESLKESD